MLIKIYSEDKNLDALSLVGCPLIKFKNGVAKMVVSSTEAGHLIQEISKSKGYRLVILPRFMI